MSEIVFVCVINQFFIFKKTIQIFTKQGKEITVDLTQGLREKGPLLRAVTLGTVQLEQSFPKSLLDFQGI